MSDDPASTIAPPRDPTPAMIAAADTFMGQYASLVPPQDVVLLWQAMWDAGSVAPVLPPYQP